MHLRPTDAQSNLNGMQSLDRLVTVCYALVLSENSFSNANWHETANQVKNRDNSFPATRLEQVASQ